METYRANIMPHPDGYGVLIDAHEYALDAKGESAIITISTIKPSAPLSSFVDIVYRILENIGCNNPCDAEIEDLRWGA